MSQRRAKADLTEPKADAAVKAEGPLAIIAGGGTLPCTLADAALAQGRAVHILGIRGEADESIARFPHTWLKWGEVGKLFTTLEDQGCRDLVIIGAVTRPDLAKVRFDFGAIRNLPFLLGLGAGGDDHVLSSVVRFLEGKGYRVSTAQAKSPRNCSLRKERSARRRPRKTIGMISRRAFVWSPRLDVSTWDRRRLL